MTHTHESHELIERAHRVRFGFWVYLMSDCVLFAGFFAAYAVLQGQTFGGPGPAALFSLPFVLTETIILLTSSFTAGMAVVSMREGKKNLMLAFLGMTLCLGAAFLYMEVSEFRHLILDENGPARNAFLSSFFALVGTHGLHVAFGSLWLLILFAHLWLKGLEESVMQKLYLWSMFWHFLDVIWIFIFTFVYLFGFILR